jgi:hypothetical protein
MIKIFHVVVDNVCGSTVLSSIDIEASFLNRESAERYIEENLSDIDPDLIDIKWSLMSLQEEDS